MSRTPWIVLACAALAACGGDDVNDNPFGSTTLGTASASATDSAGTASDTAATATVTDSASTDSGTTTEDDSDSEDSNSSGLPKLDIAGAATDDSVGAMDGCRGVDFLFVIDNSGSMEDEQSNLLSSFPGFIASMEGALEDSAHSFRVMVVDTDGIGAACLPICEMFGPQGYCNGISCAGDSCEVNVGGGNTINRTIDAPCDLPGGKRYADSDETNINAAFNCIGRVGTTGSGIELVANSLQTALSNEYTGPGGCNEGFLRDDAVLVVTVITDEDDSGNDPYFTSPGDPSSWYNELAALKDYDPNSVVVLGLLGDTGEPGGQCAPYDENTGDGAENATRLREFVQNFGSKGLVGSVCAPDYNAFFDEAVALIDTTCDDFVPPE